MTRPRNIRLALHLQGTVAAQSRELSDQLVRLIGEVRAA
jgi:hypothetical protein